MKILGLDIGSTSIGWSVVDENQAIIKSGVHIFPVGVKDDDFNKSGKEVSKNVGRRMARSARRLIFRYRLRREQLKRILLENAMMPGFTVINEKMHYLPLKAKELFYLRKKALDEPITLEELGRICLLLNQRRGFKSGRKDRGKGDEKETSKLKIAMGQLDRDIEEAGARTLGEFYWLLYKASEDKKDWHNEDEPIEPLHNKAHRLDVSRYAFRATYEKEFDLIWDTQKLHHTILTEDLKKQIKDRTIFYQRKLKSAKHLVSRCRIYPKKRCSPASHPLFQEFRLWQKLADIRVTVPSNQIENYRSLAPLSLEEKQILASELKYNSKLTEPQMKKLLGFSKEATFNQIEGLGIGNRTMTQFKNALGEKKLSAMTEEEIDQLWHVLYCAEEDAELFKHLVEFYQYTGEEAENLVKINLEADYGSLCKKALKGITLHMKEGMDYTEACLAIGFHHSQDELDNPNRELATQLKRTKEDDLRNPLVNKTVSESIRLVNAIISDPDCGRPDLVRIEFARSLQKPKAFREEELARNKAKNLRREEYMEFLHAKVGRHLVRRSDLIKFELWLEMEFSETDLKKLAPNLPVDDFRRFAQKVNSKDRLKYDLWMECGRVSPYTGKVISLTTLFSPEIEVEHIIPYSKSQDNSFVNLTLSEKSFNDKAKRNRTPLEAYEVLPDGQNEIFKFKKRVEYFSEGKQKRFLFDGSEDQLKKFRPSDLANTAYISKVVRRKLLTAIRKVEITNGQITSKLREFWGLNEILNPEGKNEKSRLDHRHHAIDAIAIACTSIRFIQKLSKEATFDHRGRMRIPSFESPFEHFQDEVKKSVDRIFISYRVDSRLLVSRKNKYIHSKAKGGVTPQRTISVRGALHEEKFYGKILISPSREEAFVFRKRLSDFEKLKDFDKIVDEPTKTRLINHLLATNCISQTDLENHKMKIKFEKSKADQIKKRIKEAFANGFSYLSKPNSELSTKVIPVFKVRVMNPSEGLIQIRPKSQPNCYVEGGSNFIFAIYGSSSGSRSGMVISNFEAVKNLQNTGQLVPQNDFKGRPLLVTFHTNELFIRYENHEDEIDWNSPIELFKRLYRVVKFDQTGLIVSVLHNFGGVKADKPKEYSEGVVLAKNVNTWKGVKVKISDVGKLMRV